MTLYEIAHILLKRLPILIIAVCAGLLIGFFSQSDDVVEYSTSATIFVSSEPSNALTATATDSSESLAHELANIGNSVSFKGTVAEAANMDLEDYSISASYLSGTRQIDLTAVAPSPTELRALISTYVEQLTDVGTNVLGAASISELQEALEGDLIQSDVKSTLSAIAVDAVLGLFLGLVIILIIELVHPIARSADQLTRMFGVDVFIISSEEPKRRSCDV